jgi:hypothetical protein
MKIYVVVGAGAVVLGTIKAVSASFAFSAWEEQSGKAPVEVFYTAWEQA